ncbi:hypothetical protein KY290_030705 [Solanum tuberosum]|uniref:F-box domain-containing protein n=1 Tax=Solanum tuberosum TaxID=4113 RepID=A0ABQ7U8X0_SOLTU|nr:hypothetical protein KY290_030705 [Solanum tuberosum]
MADLADDITRMVLSNLPVKSLLRFKCVSKSWRCWISSPNLQLSNQRRGGAIVRLMSTYTFCKMSSLRPSFGLINQQFTFESLNYTFWERGEIPIESCMILGSCHGLILISLDLNVFLWNPATRFCTKVLQLPDVFKEDDHFIISYGELCFDSSKNDYKLVMFSYNSLASTEFVLVASLKDKEWKRIQFPHDILSVRDGITFQGRLHYMIKNDEIDYQAGRVDRFGPRNNITYFDPIYEKFHMFPVPKSLQQDNIIVGLGVLNECLCMTRLEYNDVEILVMKEYGVKDSWTSLFFIRNLEIDPSFGVAHPFSLNENGELALIIDKGRVIVYNSVNNNTRDVLDPEETLSIGAITYVESLISPKEEYSWNDHVHGEPDTIQLLGEQHPHKKKKFRRR